MYPRIGFIILVIFVIWLVIRLWKSPKFDKFCEFKEGKFDTPDTSKEVIKDINKSETVLTKQAENNKKEADKLTSESKGINDFLSKRGVVEPKEEDSE